MPNSDTSFEKNAGVSFAVGEASGEKSGEKLQGKFGEPSEERHAQTKSLFARGASKIENTLEKINIAPDVEIYPENLSGLERRHHKAFEHNSTFETCVHFTKSMFGPTILVMPSGFMYGGLTCTIFIFLGALACTAYNMKRLCESAAYLSEREDTSVRTYDEVAFVSFSTCTNRTKNFATLLRVVVNSLFFITHLDACTILMIVVSHNLRSVIAYHFPDLFLSIHHYLFIQVIFLMGISSIRDLKYLTPFSFVSAFLLGAVVVLSTIFYLTGNIKHPLERHQIGSIENIFRSLCVSMFCVSGITISLTLKSSMARPKYFFAFPGIYTSSLIFHAITYIPYGYLGYLRYGEETQANIILNINPETPLGISIKSCALCSVFLTSPISFYVAFNVLWTNYIKNYVPVDNLILLEFLFRYILIAISCILAHIFPNLDSKIILRGALFNVHLEVTIPAILDYVTFYPERGSGKFHGRLVRVIFFTFFGVITCTAGLILELRS